MTRHFSRFGTIFILGLLTFAPTPVQAQDPEAGIVSHPDTTVVAPQPLVPRKIEPLGSGPVRPVAASNPEAPAEDEREVDAWGAERRLGLAVTSAALGNVVPWFFNEFVRNASFSQVNPDSWWYNIEQGFGWDDNHFSTNQFAHPYQGSLYFNAFRANGYSFWESAPAAFVGSVLWECCGETHLMSINDLINTGMGGIALGEVLYRTSSMVLDNEASGASRMWKELAGFGINPMRGFSRLVTGDAGEILPNPESDWDRIPPLQTTRMNVGYRGIANDLEADSTANGVFFTLEYVHGGPLALERSAPFDFFGVIVDLNANDKKIMGRLQMSGSLWHRDLRRTERSQHRFFFFQNFDYFNNRAFEFGGQSVSAAIMSLWDVGESGDWRLGSSFDFYGMPMGAVNSDFAEAADVPGVRERYREYDFGVGVGLRGMFTVDRKGVNVLRLSFRTTYLNTLNGSIENGSDASHYIHMPSAMVRVPIRGNWSVGGDLTGFLRDSYYSAEEWDDTRQRSPQLRFYATWTGH